MYTFLRKGETVIYADNAATTRISDVAFEKMLPFLREQYGNGSSQYSFGVKAKRSITQARRQAAEAISAEPTEITFTSGGSEGNNWVLQGIPTFWRGEPIHIITSSIEHHSVLNVCRTLEKHGITVTYLPVDRNGCVSVADVELALRSDTRLVSIMMANNEIGTIQPLAEIGRLLRRRDILFHTDAVQAAGHIPVTVKDLQVDFLTASAHKFNGAKGTGFMYIKSGLDLPQMIFGGGQEYGKRAGTENVAGIVALGYALEESVINMGYEQERLTALIRATVNGLKATIPNIRINAESAKRLPGTLNVTFPNASGEAMMHLLDLKGICVSTSSACNSSKDEPSHVLLALGLSEQEAKSSIRISYGRYNTLREANEIVTAICNAYEKIADVKKNQGMNQITTPNQLCITKAIE
jgi:cysteine desulfurase